MMKWEEVRKILDNEIEEPVYIGDLENKLYDKMPADVASEYQERMRAYLNKKGMIKEDMDLSAHEMVGTCHAVLDIALRKINHGDVEGARDILSSALTDIRSKFPHLGDLGSQGDTMKVSEDVEVVLDGQRILLEKGDVVVVEGRIKRQPIVGRSSKLDATVNFTVQDLNNQKLEDMIMARVAPLFGERFDPAGEDEDAIYDAELEVEVSALFNTGERQTWDHPGEPPSIEIDEINSVTATLDDGRELDVTDQVADILDNAIFYEKATEQLYDQPDPEPEPPDPPDHYSEIY